MTGWMVVALGYLVGALVWGFFVTLGHRGGRREH